MNQYNLVMMHYSYPPVVGGVENVVQKHAELFSDRGYTVNILTGRGESSRANIKIEKFDLLDSANSRILEIKNKLDEGEIPPAFYQAKTELKTWLEPRLMKADAIIAHNICTLHKNLPLSAALYEFMHNDYAPPLVAWNHDFAWTNKQYLPQLYDEWPWDILKQVWSPNHFHVTVSNDRKIQLSELLRIPPSEIFVIPSGIEYEKVLNLDPKTVEIINYFSLENAFPILLLPSRITRRKNIEFAIDVVNELKTYCPSVVLIITGPPGPHNPKNQSYFNELKELTSRYDLTPAKKDGKNGARVIFLAEYTDAFLSLETIYSLFRISDALFFPSLQEGFGIPILEAGITGIPIFCSNIGPFHETAGDFANYFDLTESPSKVAAIIRKFFKGNEISLLKKRIRQKYTWGSIFSQVIEPLVIKAINHRKRLIND